MRHVLTPKTTTASKYGGYSGILKAFEGTAATGTPKTQSSLKFVVDFGLSSVLLTESITLRSLGASSKRAPQQGTPLRILRRAPVK